MAWSNPRTWVSGEQVTASIMNTYVRDEFSYLKDSPFFDGSIDVAGSITAGSGNVGIVGSDGRIPAISATYFASLAGITVTQTCNGRLTLTTAVPVTVADVTAATTLFWALYGGNQIALYTGSTWTIMTVAQLSIAVPATTNTMYDVFVDYNAGTPALAVTAWTNDTTRATALTLQDGVLVLTGTLGKRYVGSFRTTGVSGQTEDSFAKRYVWNYYHRLPRPVRVLEATNSWLYSTATWRQANGAAGNQVEFVIGVAEVVADFSIYALAIDSTTSCLASVAVGLDTVTAPTATNRMGTFANASWMTPIAASLRVYPAIGFHYAAWLEYSGSINNMTWFGDNNAPTLYQAGLFGEITG